MIKNSQETIISQTFRPDQFTTASKKAILPGMNCSTLFPSNDCIQTNAFKDSPEYFFFSASNFSGSGARDFFSP